MQNLASLMYHLLFRSVMMETEFHAQAKLASAMTSSDTSGIVDSLCDFMVGCATVDMFIDTDTQALDKTLNENWLEKINKEYRGMGIEVGLRGLQKEYYKELWKCASFPVLKILRWEEIDGINLPVSMVFADGGSVYAEDKEKTGKQDLFAYDYFIGSDVKDREPIEAESHFLYKPGVRIFDKYPVPFLFRRGIYKNWKIIDMLKDKEMNLVEKVIPYMLQVLEGDPDLLKAGITWSKEELIEIKHNLQEMMDKVNRFDVNGNDGLQLSNKMPLRVGNFGEKINQLIPEVEPMFKQALFTSAEKNILAGFGFVEVVDISSASRRESVLSPLVFMKEVNTGIKDFAAILNDLISLIKEKNVNSTKSNSKKWIVGYKPVTEFMSDAFCTMMRSMSDRGLISNETADFITSKGQVDYELERRYRMREMKQSDDWVMYPKKIQDAEQNVTVEEMFRQSKSPDKMDKLPESKKGPEKMNFKSAALQPQSYDGEYLDEDVLYGEEEIDENFSVARVKKDYSTTQYIRIRQIEPKDCDKESFKTEVIDADLGISALVAKRIDSDKVEIQSFIFSRQKDWDIKKAKRWLVERAQKELELAGAPYSNIAELPKNIQESLNLEMQRKWMAIWNSSYKFYFKKFNGDKKKAEAMAFKTAYSKTRELKRAEEGNIFTKAKLALMDKQAQLIDYLQSLNKKEGE